MKYTQLMKFIINNHHIPFEYWSLCYKKNTCVANTPIDKLNMVFKDAIEAAGGVVRFEDKFSALDNFSSVVNKSACFKEGNRGNFELFCNAIIGEQIIDEKEKIRKLCESMTKFKQIGQKKSAMFIKNIVMFSGNEIFNINQSYQKYLIVPVDRVLIEIGRIIFKSAFSLDKIKEKDIEQIKEIANVYFPEQPVLFDDFWFWGHFSLNKDNRLSYNKIRLKTDRIATEEFIAKYSLPQKIKEFVNLVVSV